MCPALIVAEAAHWSWIWQDERGRHLIMKIIGILNSGSPETLGEQFDAFHRGLREAGYVDVQNVTIEYRWANDDYDRLAPLAAELVRLKVAVLVAAAGTVSAQAARDATKG